MKISFNNINKLNNVNTINTNVNFKCQKEEKQIDDLNKQGSSITGRSLVEGKKIQTHIFINNFLEEKDQVKATKMLLQRYPELSWLTEKVDATPEGVSNAKSSSISENLFGEKHIEFDRTIVGIECLKEVINGDYDSFTKCQKDAVKLTKEQFEELRAFTLDVLKTPEDIDAMIAYTVINDLGKIKSFTHHVEEKTGIKANDHDEALLIGLKTLPEEIPSFNRLSTTYKNNILNALNTGFNLAQFVQCECLEENLTGLKNINPTARDLYLVHVFYDVAGAAGHVNPNGSLVMTSPVYTGYMQGIESICNPENKTELETYNNFLAKKAESLGVSIENIEQRALLKLSIMSRATNKQDVDDIVKAYKKLTKEEQTELVTGLNKNGITDSGVILYYAPAFLQNSMNVAPENKIEMLSKAFKVMSNIYSNTKSNEKSGVRTISLSDIANKIKEEPNISADELYNLLN